jgi:hypothetical protein
MIKKYPRLFLLIGIALVIGGMSMAKETKTKYWTSMVLCGVGGFTTGFSLRHINEKPEA